MGSFHSPKMQKCQGQKSERHRKARAGLTGRRSFRAANGGRPGEAAVVMLQSCTLQNDPR